ncbi:hypothetical protein AWB76_07575 [Caballeronia temeraria]|uniref:Lipoprotein n=2 Tax=Caballeronia temeraria TaxID=1777137 RepID=A0A158DYE1_9BURK|nr:hypothetical protein AWB76_07575 [Caballeronia temeraria]
MLRSRLCWFTLLSVLQACQTLPLPESAGERNSRFTYIPIDPLPTTASLGDSCPDGYSVEPYMDLFPDQAVRIAIASFDVQGNLSIGPAAKFGTENNIYQVTLDFISVDTKNATVFVEGITATGRGAAPSGVAKPAYRITKDPDNPAWASYDKNKSYPTSNLGEPVAVPVYVGVGLRLIATVRVLKGTVNLSSLSSITAGVESGKATGSLVVQTLGVSGSKISAMLPMPSELNQTTIQNAILALGSIKALLFDPTTHVVPRVVGIYNPIGGGEATVNQIVSILAEDKLVVEGECIQNDVTARQAQAASSPAGAVKPPIKSTPAKRAMPR